MHKIKVEKPRGLYRVVVEMPSGKKEVRWVNSKNSIWQICSEYMVPFDSIKWEPMR